MSADDARRPERSEGTHALSIRRLSVASDERETYLARLAERQASARACGVHFWAFEREHTPGEFVEFVETADRRALATALDQDALFVEGLDFRLAPTRAELDARAEIFAEIVTPHPS